MTSSAFGYELGERLEQRLLGLGTWNVITLEALAGFAPPHVAPEVVRIRALAVDDRGCVHLRQVASLADVAVVVCGNVRAIEGGVFEVYAMVFQRGNGEPLRLDPILGRDADSVAITISNRLPRSDE
jgi:hypothetical protein